MIKVYEVENIKCSGCANSIKKALKDKFDKIDINLNVIPRQITVDINNNEDEFKDILRNLGYPLVDDNSSSITKVQMKAKSFVSCAVGKFSLDKD
jgi:copper chaperone CopZ